MILAYPAATALAVIVTANHFWLDGIAAAALLALALAVQWAGRMARQRRRAWYRARAVPGQASYPADPESPRVPAARP